MNKLSYLIFPIVFLSACSNRAYPDFSNYTLDDFLHEPATCDRKSQCKYVGYGNQNGGCSRPVFEGLVIYSTKLGPRNIKHLEKIALETTPWLQKSSKNYSTFFENVEYELEECLPIGNHIPNLQCQNNICVDTFWDNL